MDNHPLKLFDGIISTLSRSMDLRARRHEMVLGNVANADTPNYRPFSMDVEKALQNGSQQTMTEGLSRTDARHLPGAAQSNDPGTENQPSAADPLLFRGDGNGVDIDAEMTALAKNSLLYKVSAQIVGSKFKGLKNVITGGTR